MPESSAEVMRKNIHSILTVSASTLGSRILGLIRDVLLYAQLGLGPTLSAFLLAFTLPNLFRRLFGEGALSSALIPVFAEEDHRSGRTAAFQLLNRTLSRLVLVLIVLCLLLIVPMALLLWMGNWEGSRYEEAVQLGILLFPYVMPICAAALIAGALQTLGRFFTPAITPVLLNISMIVFLVGPGIWFADTVFQKALWLSAGVLFGGALQLSLPAIDLLRRGWLPAVDLSPDPALSRLQALFVPAVAGAAILQVNILVSRSFAFFVDADGVALLYLAARLVELPLGIFGIAAATVLFPELSRLAASASHEPFRASYRGGSSLVASITVPATVGLAVLADPILRALFAWGLFDARDAEIAAPILAIFAAGLPFYAQATLLSRAHQARQDMRTPVRVAGWVLLANFVLSIALMVPFGIHGLAAANGLAAALQVILLHRFLHQNTGSKGSWIPPELWKVATGSCALLVFLCWIPTPGPNAARSDLFLFLAWVIPTGGLIAIGCMALLRFSPLQPFLPLKRRNHG